jgi:hypothetical protein
LTVEYHRREIAVMILQRLTKHLTLTIDNTDEILMELVCRDNSKLLINGFLRQQQLNIEYQTCLKEQPNNTLVLQIVVCLGIDNARALKMEHDNRLIWCFNGFITLKTVTCAVRENVILRPIFTTLKVECL